MPSTQLLEDYALATRMMKMIRVMTDRLSRGTDLDQVSELPLSTSSSNSTKLIKRIISSI